MNKIKRKKERENDLLLNYRFGIHRHKEHSEKMIRAFIKNKRILFEEDLLSECMLETYSVETIKLLITEEILDAQDKEGDTPLHVAVIFLQPEEIIELLITKRNLEAKCNNKNTPLHLALFNNNNKIDVIKLLITKDNLNMRNDDENTPLHIALEENYPEEVIRLLITEENVNVVNDEYYTPYEKAIEKKNYSEEILELLMEK